jgi:hypothetical protein
MTIDCLDIFVIHLLDTCAMHIELLNPNKQELRLLLSCDDPGHRRVGNSQLQGTPNFSKSQGPFPNFAPQIPLASRLIIALPCLFDH